MVLVDGKTTPLGRVADHLKALGVSATLIRGDTRSDFSVRSATLREVLDESIAKGVDLDEAFDSISVRPPNLRDLLQRDPSLRSAIATEEVAP